MKRTIAISLALLLSVTSASYSQDAFLEYHSGNYAQAVDGLRKLADSRNGEASYYMAMMLMNGFGVKKNFQQGLEEMIKSGTMKYLPAQIYLGNYYFHQKKDLVEAFLWYQRAADLGDSSAQLYTGLAYMHGYGVKKNEDKARKYYIDAAKNGVGMAQYNLANIFLDSKHKADVKLGSIWLIKAAEKNYLDAEYQIGMMLYTGDKVDKNQEHGLSWLRKAAEQKDPRAQSALDQIKSGQQPSFTQNSTDSTAVSQNPWGEMSSYIKKAGVTLINPNIITASESDMTKTPRLILLKKESIVQPNYSLVLPSEIPISQIYSYMAKQMYLSQKPQLIFPQYNFTLPVGAKNYTEAYKILLQEAKHGYPVGFYQLAQMFSKGLGIPRDDKKAFDLYERAAKNDILRAQYCLALYYLEGKAITPDYKIAVELLAKSALRGSQNAQFVLGTLYEYGINKSGEDNYIEKNLDQAKAMYSLAAQNGLALAQYRLAELYASGTLNPQNNMAVEAEESALAYKLYQAAANNGIQQAEVPLAYYYANQKKSAEMQEKAFAIAKRESEKGNKSAKLLLAVLYDRGIGTSRSIGKSEKLLEQLSGESNTIAEFMLGTLYLEQNKKKDQAIMLLEKSANQGNVYAQYNLAILAQNNQYNSPGLNFVELLTKAVNNNYNKASILLADYYLMRGENIKEAAQIYNNLAEKQDTTAQVKLGFMYENGLMFAQDYQKAREWYEKAAKNNNSTAQYLLGNMYQFGKGVQRNVDTALNFYKSSAEQNYVPAEVALGYMFEVDLHDYSKALNWYQKAVENNNPQARYNLGLMYEYGKGVKADRSKAEDLFKAAEKFNQM